MVSFLLDATGQTKPSKKGKRTGKSERAEDVKVDSHMHRNTLSPQKSVLIMECEDILT